MSNLELIRYLSYSNIYSIKNNFNKNIDLLSLKIYIIHFVVVVHSLLQTKQIISNTLSISNL